MENKNIIQEFTYKNITYFCKNGAYSKENIHEDAESIGVEEYKKYLELYIEWQKEKKARNKEEYKKLNYSKEKSNVLDLFCGAGGFSLGFQEAKFHIVGAIDNDEYACETFRANFPATVVIEDDITQLKFEDLPFEKTKIDGIIGGPPCQGFSVIGRTKIKNLIKKGTWIPKPLINEKFIDDSRNILYKKFVKFVGFYIPKFFVMENVPGLYNYGNGAFKNQIKRDFIALGYRVDVRLFNAVRFGVPEFRKRVFFVGNRLHKISSIKEIPNIFPLPTHSRPKKKRNIFFKLKDYETLQKYIEKHSNKEIIDHNYRINSNSRSIGKNNLGIIDTLQIDLFGNTIEYKLNPDFGLKPPVTLEQAISDLAFIKEGEGAKINSYKEDFPPVSLYQIQMRLASKSVHNHEARALAKQDEEIFNWLEQGQIYNQLPEHLKRYGDGDSFPDKMKRLRYDRPSGTIVAHLHKDGYMFIHPTINRTITVREAARIQSFPDNFIFQGCRSDQFKQVGNAVPPILSKVIANSIKFLLKKFDKIEHYTKSD